MVHKRIGKKNLVDAELNGKQSTLSNFGFITKTVTKATKKLKKSGKHDECNNKVVIICRHYGNFYCCLNALYEYVSDCFLKEYCLYYPNCDDNCEYFPNCQCETIASDEAYDLLDALLWKKNNNLFGKCKCEVIKTIDEEITEREYLNELSKYEPCRFKCAYLRNIGECQYEKERKIRESIKQRKLDRYFRK
jgi:hypothetical protein